MEMKQGECGGGGACASPLTSDLRRGTRREVGGDPLKLTLHEGGTGCDYEEK